VNRNLVEMTDQHSHLQSIATLAVSLLGHAGVRQGFVPDDTAPSSRDMENMMKGSLMMILASALLAGSLVATDAQARGGGGGHGGFGGGHMGGFGGGHIGGFGVARIGSLGTGRMAQMGHDRFGVGRRHFVGGLYDYGLDCPYYDQSYTPPYNCTY
jgi:hypothetical protein